MRRMWTVLVPFLAVMLVLGGCTTPTTAPTPIPSPEPVPSPPPTPAPQVLFSDDFSDNTSGWDTYEDEDGWVNYEGGWLHVTNYTTSEYNTASHAHQHFADFILEVETKLVAGTDDNYHQICVRTKDTMNYYFFDISADGYYAIGTVVEGSTEPLLAEPTRSIHILKGRDVTNLVRVECVGSTLRLSVNGHLLQEFTDTRFRSGDIALAASSLAGTSTEVAFDNIVVIAAPGSPPEEVAPAPTPPPAPEPEKPSEPAIPAHFTTYTHEGLFSISYPSDWQPATSIMEELWEETRAELEVQYPGVSLENIGMLFFGGKETWEGYYPTVSIVTDLRAPGYWTLDEVDEANSRADKEYTPGYKELSLYKTIVDEKDASILDCEDNSPGYGRWRYIQLTTVKGDFAWCVSCGCEYEDFDDYEDTFNSIVRSLRILN